MERAWHILTSVYPWFALARYPIFVSVCYYLLSLVIGITLRAVVSNHVSARWQPYLLNAITAFQAMACSLENKHVRDFYGWTAYWLTLVTLSMLSALTVSNSSSNPCSQMLHYMKGLITAKEMLLRMCCQVAGGLLSYRYARYFWSLGLHAGHVSRHGLTSCDSDLTVSPTLGFVIEFSLTFFDVMTERVVITSYHVTERGVKVGISSFFVTLGLHLTGMYANPVNATNQTFGCNGTTALEHITVYWGAPLAATVVAYQLHYLITKALREPSTSKKKERRGQVKDRTEVKETSKVTKNGSSYYEDSLAALKGLEDSLPNGTVRIRRTGSRTKRA